MMENEKTIAVPISLVQRIIQHIASRFNDDIRAAQLITDIQACANEPQPNSEAQA